MASCNGCTNEALKLELGNRYAKPTTGTFILADERNTVEFRLQGHRVLVVRKGEWCSRAFLTVGAARAEYRRLLDAGYVEW